MKLMHVKMDKRQHLMPQRFTLLSVQQVIGIREKSDIHHLICLKTGKVQGLPVLTARV